MVVFVQKTNGLTGCSEWDVQDDNYDYHQEVARSAFADMLHDTERNQKYFLALKAAIDKMHDSGKPANVLDIGTGTGLLSIMAAQCGADSIVACEGFQPMADCASKIIDANGFSKKIIVIPKRSTQITVGDGGDMKQRANILVTEVFDTELIGEGAIETFSHAHSELLEKDCIVVPDSGTVYAQVVECPLMQQWNKLVDLTDEDGNILVKTPFQMKECQESASSVHDLQLSQLPRSSFKEVLKPVAVFQYDWSGKTPINKKKSSIVQGKSLITCNAQMVFMWWDLNMDTEGKILLSCAPWWCHPDSKPSHHYPQDTIPWRDHWVQAIYYFPKEVAVKQDDIVTLISSHDEFSLWFNLKKCQKVSPEDYVRPVCDCGVHMVYSRSHVASMNNRIENTIKLRALKNVVDENTICLCLNGTSLMGLAVAKLGAKKVFYIEPGITSKRILQSYISSNDLLNSVIILPDIETLFKSYPNDFVSLIYADPNFNSALLPWDNLYMGYIMGKYKSMFGKNLKIIPGACSLWTMSVEFLDLHKIKSSLDVCENIDLKIFDELVQNSRSISDDAIEPQPLWEYPCICRSNPIKLIDIDLNKVQETTVEISGSQPCKIDGTYNGFPVWVEWDLDGNPNNKLTTGPIVEPELNKRVSWYPYSRQGVKILEKNMKQHTGSLLTYHVKCNLSNGIFGVDVEIK